MEGLKVVIQALSVTIAIIIYIGIWWSMIVNWDRCMKTIYAYPCWEQFLSGLYDIWIAIHMILLAYAFIWAWG